MRSTMGVPRLGLAKPGEKVFLLHQLLVWGEADLQNVARARILWAADAQRAPLPLIGRHNAEEAAGLTIARDLHQHSLHP